MSDKKIQAAESEQVNISKVKGFLFPLIAIVVIVAIAVVSCIFLFDKEQLTTTKFVKYMENEGYVVSEVEGKKHNYLQAVKGDIYIQFFHEETEETTDKYFEKNKKTIKKYYKDCEETEDKIIGKDTETFMIVSRNDKNYLFTQCDVSKFDEVDKIFESLDY